VKHIMRRPNKLFALISALMAAGLITALPGDFRPLKSTNKLQAQTVITPGRARKTRSARTQNTGVAVQPGRRKKGGPGRKNAAVDRWHIIQLDDKRIGYVRVTTRRLTKNRTTIVRTNTEHSLQLKRYGQKLKIRTLMETDETEQGDLISFSLEMRNPPAQTTRTVGRVDGKWLKVKATVAGRSDPNSVPWEPNIKSTDYQDRLLRETPLKPGQTRKLKAFVPELNQVITVHLAADNYRHVKLLDGKFRKLLLVRITRSSTPDMPVRVYLDEHGEPLKTETGFLGKTMVTYAVTEKVAMEKIAAGGDLDIAVNSLVHVGPIRRGHNARKVVYRVNTPGRDPAKYFVADKRQQIKQIDTETIELTVGRVEVPRRPVASKADREYLAAARFIQSDDARVIQHANRAARGQLDHSKMAVAMEQYVNKKLSKKNFSTALASAAEVAKSLEGDCTEHAILLAAMLRAKKIPSRIAVGLVYVEGREAFGGHMWTEALLGDEWIPLDATLGRGGIGAAHLKMAHSSFSDEGPAPVTAFLPLISVLGNLQIEIVKVD